MKPIIYLFVLLMCAILSSCSNDVIYSKLTQVNYGTSFGECEGYCKRGISVDSLKASINCSSWSAELKPITSVIPTPKSTWDSIRVLANNKDFFSLPLIIGCPDCADGGAEWIELKLPDGTKHKVIFEYGHEPEIVKPYIGTLRYLLGKNKCK